MNKQLALFFLILAVPAAHAERLKVVATASVKDYVDPNGIFPFAEANLSEGMTLSVIFDTTASDLAANDPHTGVYVSSIDVTFQVGNVVVDQTRGDILVADDLPAASPPNAAVDLWVARGYLSPPVAGPGVLSRAGTIGLELVFTKSAALVSPLHSDGLSAPPWPSVWEFARISYSIDDTGIGGTTRVATVSGNVTNLSVSTVPIPSTIWLLLTALAVALTRIKRRYGRVQPMLL